MFWGTLIGYGLIEADKYDNMHKFLYAILYLGQVYGSCSLIQDVQDYIIFTNMSLCDKILTHCWLNCITYFNQAAAFIHLLLQKDRA